VNPRRIRRVNPGGFGGAVGALRAVRPCSVVLLGILIRPSVRRAGSAPGAGVQGKEDKHDMAKTTRKTEPTTAEKKPATRRPKAAPVAGAEQVATRRRTKASTDAAPIAEAAEVRAASLKQPGEQGFGAEPTHDEIALRAWSIYENRGGGHGQAFDDWVEAKRQLHEERGLE